MRKTILFILAVVALSCSNDNSAPNTVVIPDAIAGKWIIYKAEYSDAQHVTAYEYAINGQCGSQALEMIQRFNPDYNYILETYYTNEDCTTFDSNMIGRWVKTASGAYNIYDGSTVPIRTLTLSDNEIKVIEPGFITLTKYYKKAVAE